MEIIENGVEFHKQSLLGFTQLALNLKRDMEGVRALFKGNRFELETRLKLFDIDLHLLHNRRSQFLSRAVFVHIANTKIINKAAIPLLGVEQVVQICNDTPQQLLLTVTSQLP